MISKLTKWIASAGQNIQFVAFFAHFGVAALVVENTGHPKEMTIIVIILAAIKEYYFDARDEVNPPQSFWDNTEDFIGWTLGTLVGWILI